MIDLATEICLSLTQAAALLPPGRGGRPVTFACVLRWVLDGVKLPDGTVVRLEAVRLGARWVTSREAIQRLEDRQTPLLDRPAPATPRTASTRRRASERAGEELERAGI